MSGGGQEFCLVKHLINRQIRPVRLNTTKDLKSCFPVTSDEFESFVERFFSHTYPYVREVLLPDWTAAISLEDSVFLADILLLSYPCLLRLPEGICYRLSSLRDYVTPDCDLTDLPSRLYVTDDSGSTRLSNSSFEQLMETFLRTKKFQNIDLRPLRSYISFNWDLLLEERVFENVKWIGLDLTQFKARRGALVQLGRQLAEAEQLNAFASLEFLRYYTGSYSDNVVSGWNRTLRTLKGKTKNVRIRMDLPLQRKYKSFLSLADEVELFAILLNPDLRKCQQLEFPRLRKIVVNSFPRCDLVDKYLTLINAPNVTCLEFQGQSVLQALRGMLLLFRAQVTSVTAHYVDHFVSWGRPSPLGSRFKQGFIRLRRGSVTSGTGRRILTVRRADTTAGFHRSQLDVDDLDISVSSDDSLVTLSSGSSSEVSWSETTADGSTNLLEDVSEDTKKLRFDCGIVESCINSCQDVFRMLSTCFKLDNLHLTFECHYGSMTQFLMFLIKQGNSKIRPSLTYTPVVMAGDLPLSIRGIIFASLRSWDSVSLKFNASNLSCKDCINMLMEDIKRERSYHSKMKLFFHCSDGSCMTVVDKDYSRPITFMNFPPGPMVYRFRNIDMQRRACDPHLAEAYRAATQDLDILAKLMTCELLGVEQPQLLTPETLEDFVSKLSCAGGAFSLLRMLEPMSEDEDEIQRCFTRVLNPMI
ncbi:hypothetical protein HDE_12958 [Halotydeus destructor]|nr:hypothetical protein HDE_12958 [Halotydeus destructor]